MMFFLSVKSMISCSEGIVPPYMTLLKGFPENLLANQNGNYNIIISLWSIKTRLRIETGSMTLIIETTTSERSTGIKSCMYQTLPSAETETLKCLQMATSWDTPKADRQFLINNTEI